MVMVVVKAATPSQRHVDGHGAQRTSKRVTPGLFPTRGMPPGDSSGTQGHTWPLHTTESRSASPHALVKVGTTSSGRSHSPNSSSTAQWPPTRGKPARTFHLIGVGFLFFSLTSWSSSRRAPPPAPPCRRHSQQCCCPRQPFCSVVARSHVQERVACRGKDPLAERRVKLK